MIKSNIFFSIPADRLPEITLANSVTIDLPYIHFRRTPVEYILYIVLDGVMYLTEGDTEYTLEAGDFIFLDPSRCHFGREGSRCYYYYIHFTVPGITELYEKEADYLQTLFQERIQATIPTDSQAADNISLLLPKYFHLPERSCMRLQHAAKNMVLNYHTPVEFHMQTAQCLLLSLFIMMQQTLTDHALEKNKHQRDTLPLEITAYLKIYYNEKITGERIENHFFRNFDYLNRIFKKAIGTPIFQWLNQYRVNVAKKLLQTDLYTYQQIAEKTGFANQFYFSRVFKKITGITPSEYQNQSIHQ